MANEITVQSGLSIRNPATFLNYRSPVTGFVATITGNKGPTPGAVTVTTTGGDVDLSGLTQPGMCCFTNIGRLTGTALTTDYVQVGIHDGTLFHSFIELFPGESYVVRLSRDFGEENTVPGTGTSATINTLYAKAFGASQVLQVDAFES